MKKEVQMFSFRKRALSFKFAFNGLKAFFKNEHNSWIHACAAIFCIIAGFYFKITVTEWCLLVFAIGLVFIAEIINSAIENAVDLFSMQYSKKAESAKDMAAAGVLTAAIVSVIIGIIIFLPKILNL